MDGLEVLDPLAWPLPDREVACAFADAFCGGQPWRLRLAVYGVPGMARDFERGDGKLNAVEAHWDEIVALQEAGNQVFFYLNKMREGHGGGHNGIAINADVEDFQTLSVDFDGGLPEHYHAEPDIIIKTSQRLLPDGRMIQRGQALWFVASSPDLSQAQYAGIFKEAQLRLAAYYDPKGMAGWLKDKKNPGPQITDKGVTDLRRVHRLPGSLHLKDPTNPQPVTFERRFTGMRRGIGLIYYDLPKLPEAEKPEIEKPAETNDGGAIASRGRCSGAPKRRVVAEIILRETLSWIDPPAAEPEWQDLIAAIEGVDIRAGDKEQVAVDWSRGELDRGGRYDGETPAGFTGDADVRAKYQQKVAQRRNREKAGKPCTGFTTLLEAARLGGMPQDDRISREWRAFIADQAGSSQDQAGSIDPPEPFLLRTSDLLAWPDPKPLVADFLMQGEDACLYSPPKSGKTFVALDVGLSLAAGLPVLGHLNVLRPGEAVVYLSGEGHAGMKRRIMAWGAARGLTREQIEALPFYYKTSVPPTKDGNAVALRYIAGIRQVCTPVLIVIDTMSRSLGAEDENTAAAANAYLNMVGAIREAFGCTTLTLAHSGKGEGAAARGVRGSSAFTGGFDAIWLLEANKENRTAKLEAAWLKDADEMGPHCFRMEQVQVGGMGMGAVLRYLPLTEYKDPETRGAATTALLFRIRMLLTENRITDHYPAWTHAVLAEKLMPTPRPDKDENVNTVLAWETEHKALTRDVNNAKRSAEGKRMGGMHVIQLGGGGVWCWYLPRG